MHLIDSRYMRLDQREFLSQIEGQTSTTVPIETLECRRLLPNGLSNPDLLHYVTGPLGSYLSYRKVFQFVVLTKI